MPAKKIAKKAVKKVVKKSVKSKKSSGTCTVCSAGVKPLTIKTALKSEDHQPVIESMPEPQVERVESCVRCDHVPGRVSAVIGLLAVVIVLLSITVMASVMIISSQAFQIEAYNSTGGFIDNIVRN